MNDQPPRKSLPTWVIAMLVVIAILVLGFGVCVRTLSF
jgi:hypothetical protein